MKRAILSWLATMRLRYAGYASLALVAGLAAYEAVLPLYCRYLNRKEKKCTVT